MIHQEASFAEKSPDEEVDEIKKDEIEWNVSEKSPNETPLKEKLEIRKAEWELE